MRPRALGFIVVVGMLLAIALPLQAVGGSANHLPAIWVGSPVVGTWGVARDASTTPAGGHHKLGKASPANQWSVDLTALPTNNYGVYVYAAAANASLNSHVWAKVTQIVTTNACVVGGGGDFVTVGFYYDSTLIGRATYAHINRDTTLYVGQTVNRWGGYLGSAGTYAVNSRCWTGRHVHFEMRSESHYSCWNKGYTYPGYPVNRSNFLGFIGGNLSTVSARACP